MPIATNQMSRCPPPPNTDPKRKYLYIPPNPSRSEPLSHSEYLRRLKENNGCAISSPNAILQVGTGELQGQSQKYITTIWTSSKNYSCAPGKAVPAVPPVHPGGHALDAGMTEFMNGAVAARGSISKFDTTNKTAWTTTYKKEGLAIVQDNEYKAPAGVPEGREICTDCTLQGTTDVVPGNPNCCS